MHDPLRHAPALAGGIIIYRLNPKTLRAEILCGEKKTGKWKGRLTICFAKRAERGHNPLAAAMNVVKKKLNGDLDLGPPKFLNTYGTLVFASKLELNDKFDIKGIHRTSEVMETLHFQTFVFVCKCKSGEPKDSSEVGAPRFMDIREVARENRKLALDQKQMLFHLSVFLKKAT